MPLFPNINTLVNKATLSGQEVIQISATEKATLQQIVEQLGFTPSSLLTGLEEIAPGGLSLPAATDTLIQALAKLVSLVGGDKMIILPVPPRLDWGERPGECRFVVLIDNSVYDSEATSGTVACLSFYQTQITVSYRVWETAATHPLLTCHTAQDLDNWVMNNNPNIWACWGESLIETASNRIGFNPGDVIFHTGDSITNIIVPIYYWNGSRYRFSANSAMIISQVNILKNMFNEASAGLITDVTYIFSEDFDESPGTQYQCVTIQKVRYSGGKSTFLVNKGGYVPNT